MVCTIYTCTIMKKKVETNPKKNSESNSESSSESNSESTIVVNEFNNKQNDESNSANPAAESGIEPTNPEKSISKSKPEVKIEDYDLVVNSLKEATVSFKDVIFSLGKKAQEIRDKAEETFAVGAKRDALDIQALGSYAENVTKDFEDTMIEIKKRDYGDEEKLLKGYKKLLEEQISLINARMELVKRLKSR